MMEENEWIPQQHQRLNFFGKKLQDSRLVSDYDIQNELTIQLLLRLRGGGGDRNLSPIIGYQQEEHPVIWEYENCAIPYKMESTEVAVWHITKALEKIDITSPLKLIIEQKIRSDKLETRRYSKI